MPVDTEFEVHYDDGRKATTNMIMKENGYGKKYLDWIDSGKLKVYTFLADTIFIPIQHPVSFMETINEAINNKKRIKCTHYRFVRSGEYMNISEMFTCMGQGAKDFPMDLISNGKWYIEESEADSNE